MLDQAAPYNLIAKEFFTSSIESGMSWQRYLIKTSTNVETEFCALIGHKGFSCLKAVFWFFLITAALYAALELEQFLAKTTSKFDCLVRETLFYMQA